MKDRMGNTLTTTEAAEKVAARIANVFLDFELMILRWIGYVPFHHVRRFFYRLAGMKIGKGSTLHMFANFFNPENIVIGQDSVIGTRAFLDGRDKLTIGNHVAVASEVMIYNSQHDVDREDFSAIEAPVTIGDYVFIGPRAVILPGVTIGKGAVVAAAAVVTEDVKDYEVVGGVPAKVIRKRRLTDPHYRVGRARWFQ